MSVIKKNSSVRTKNALKKRRRCSKMWLKGSMRVKRRRCFEKIAVWFKRRNAIEKDSSMKTQNLIQRRCGCLVWIINILMWPGLLRVRLPKLGFRMVEFFWFTKFHDDLDRKMVIYNPNSTLFQLFCGFVKSGCVSHRKCRSRRLFPKRW